MTMDMLGDLPRPSPVALLTLLCSLKKGILYMYHYTCFTSIIYVLVSKSLAGAWSPLSIKLPNMKSCRSLFFIIHPDRVLWMVIVMLTSAILIFESKKVELKYHSATKVAVLVIIMMEEGKESLYGYLVHFSVHLTALCLLSSWVFLCLL